MRISLCNEVVAGMPFERQCAFARTVGYDGIEVAPFTLTDDPTRLSAARAAEWRRAAAEAGIAITSLHYLLRAPSGLSITTPDPGQRRRTLDVMHALCTLAAELGARVLVHGSPDQRTLAPGKEDESRKRGIDCFAAMAEPAAKAGVVYCIEPLARNQTAFINSVAEAADIVRAIDSPAVRTMIDCSAAGQTEAEPVADLVRRWVPTGLIGHIHFNDPNRRGPGEGSLAFAPILAALAASRYAGDSAVEPFIYEPDGPTCAARQIGYLRGLMEAGNHMSKPRLRLMEASFPNERPVKLRLPFRFGVVTLTQAPQAFVRARIRLADGREEEGVSAELLVPKWFDKSTALSNEDNFDQLRRSLALARKHVLAAGTDTAFGLSASVEAAHHAACAQAGLNGLIASFGLALIERSIIDALGRLERAPVFALVRVNRLGLTAATAPDLAGFDFDAFLDGLAPAPSICARHTVGLVDALTLAELAGKRLDDGLPESLEEVIAVYGHRHFKLKVAGVLDADIDRLARIAAVLDRIAEPYFATLDGNEQFDHADAVIELWRRIGAEPRLTRLKSSILFVEQPIMRSKALAEPIHALADEVPIELDESDADIGVFPAGRALGYRGISAKSCKGFYRALINRARIARWNAQSGAEQYFMSAEDLTTQAGVAVQQDLALATLVGATHVERNGHHYVDGMAGAPEHEQKAFLAAHPELYQRAGGRVRLAIRNGTLDLSSLARTPGLAVGALPDWSAMQPMKGNG